MKAGSSSHVTGDDGAAEGRDANAAGTACAAPAQGAADAVVTSAPRRIRFGVLKGRLDVAANFDAPLPEEVQKSFERGDAPG